MMNCKFLYLLSICCLTTALLLPMQALEFSIESPEQPLFGTPTSDDTVYVTTDQPVNTDRSKNAALIPPAFGSPTSYVLGSGEPLTPNLLKNGQVYTGSGNTGTTVSVSSDNDTTEAPTLPLVGTSGAATAYTEVHSSLYYADGSLGTLHIPSIGLSVPVFEGTDSASLLNGAGHFEHTSIWDGNVAIAGHNRGVNNHFGKIHTLTSDDTIEFTTKLGTRTYEVYSVQKISNTQVSILDASTSNILTLVTCVMDEPEYRWCVQAKQIS